MKQTVHGVDQDGNESPPLVGALLRRPYLEVRSRIVADLKSAGFPDIQAAHLAVFQHPGPEGRSPGELARAAGASKQAMNNLLAQLEQSDYLTRGVNPDNRRERTIRLTPRGRDLIKVIRRSVDGIEAHWRTEFGDADYERLRSLLLRLNTFVGT